MQFSLFHYVIMDYIGFIYQDKDGVVYILFIITLFLFLLLFSFLILL
jgi:hypothetical protein